MIEFLDFATFSTREIAGWSIGIALLVLALTAIKIVPQSQAYVITRLGRFARTSEAGPIWVTPIIERVHRRQPINDQVIKDVQLDVVSADNVVFAIELMVVYRVQVAEKAVFRVSDVDDLVIGLVKSLVRAEIGGYELDDVQKERDKLNRKIREVLAEAGDDYGLLISRAEITDVKLTETTQKAMSEVLEAERFKRAAISRAEGEREAVQRAADGRLYEEQKKAEAIEIVARATARATQQIGEALAAHGDGAARFQIAERQIAAIAELAKSANAKLVVVPADATNGFAAAAAIFGSGGFQLPPEGAAARSASGPWKGVAAPVEERR